jgi:hypothetical protein
MGFFYHAEHHPKIFLNSFYYVIGYQVLRFFLVGEDHFDRMNFDTTNGGNTQTISLRKPRLPMPAMPI